MLFRSKYGDQSGKAMAHDSVNGYSDALDAYDMITAEVKIIELTGLPWCLWASLVAQMVENLSARQKTRV